MSARTASVGLLLRGCNYGRTAALRHTCKTQSVLPLARSFHLRSGTLGTRTLPNVYGTALGLGILGVDARRSLSLWGTKSETTPVTQAPPPAATIPPEGAVTASILSPEGVQVPPALASSPTPSAPLEVAAVSPAPSIPELGTSLDALESTIPAALQYGDLGAMGLTSFWTPAGWARWTLEIINTTTGLNWFYTIIIGTLLWRAATIPFTITATRAAAKMKLIGPGLTKLQSEMAAAAKEGDLLTRQQKAIELAALYKSVGLGPLSPLAGLATIPLQVGFILGVTKLCSGQVIQLTHSGMSWLPDLTAQDPYHVVLPFTAGILGHLTVRTAIKMGDMDVSNPQTAKIAKVLLTMTYGAPIALYFCNSGLLVTIIVSTLFSGVQSAVLRLPRVRAYLGLPPIVRNESVQLPKLSEVFSPEAYAASQIGKP